MTTKRINLLISDFPLEVKNTRKKATMQIFE